MRKSISLFIAFILLFVSLSPNMAYADEGGSQSVTNDLYSIKLPSWAKVLSQSNDENYTTVLCDKDLTFTAKISFEKITTEDINSVRDYLSDYKSDNIQIFDKILDLRAESYDAAEKSYVNSASFYPLDKKYSELNFKIIDKQVQELFGVRSFSIMYNTLDATMDRVSEYSKIDMYIPAYGKGIYEINITIPREQASIDTILKIAELTSATSLAGHPGQVNVPLILVANDNIQRTAAGIYPAYTFKYYNMKPFNSKEMGVSFYYPDFFIPIDNVTSFDGMKNASFKIDPYTTFNVLTADSSIYSQDEAVATAFSSIEDGATFSSINILDSPNGNIYELIYSYNKNDVKYTKRTYILSANENTVVYSMLTTAQNPSYSLDNMMIRILITTKTFKKQKNSSVSAFTYKASDFGDITTDLPSDFKIQQQDSNSIKITSPTVNTFQIYVYQKELNKNIDFESASKLATSDGSQIIKNNLSTQFNSSQSTYIDGRLDFGNDSARIYKLSKYLDSDNRLHYCYTVSIARGDKLYTMLFDINGLLFKEDGKVGRTIPKVLNQIAQSFRFK